MSEDGADDGDSGQSSGQPGGQGQTGGQSAGQPQGQPANQTQGQSAGQSSQTQGQSAGQSGQYDAAGATRSPTDILSEPVGQAVIKYVVVTFAAVSGALGLLGMLATSILSSGTIGSAAATSSYSTMLFGGGPLLAAVLSLLGVFEVGETENESYALAFVSGAAGHLVLTFIGGIFAAIAVNFFQFGDAIVAGIFMALGTGLVAAAVMWVRNWSDIPQQ